MGLTEDLSRYGRDVLQRLVADLNKHRCVAVAPNRNRCGKPTGHDGPHWTNDDGKTVEWASGGRP